MHQQLACVLLTPHVNCAPQPGHTESGAREFSGGEFMLPMIRAKAQIIRTTGCGLRVAGCGLRVAGYGLRVTGYGLRGAGCGVRGA